MSTVNILFHIWVAGFLFYLGNLLAQATIDPVYSRNLSNSILHAVCFAICWPVCLGYTLLYSICNELRRLWEA